MVGSARLFGRKDDKTQLTASRKWARAGVEPSTTALLADPIAILLMRADRLSTEEVEAVLREARKRLPSRTARTRPISNYEHELHTAL